MKHTKNRRDIWLKAAVVGSLWASLEIVVGSFLHNIHAPFSGTLLGFFSLSLLIAFHHKWQDKGLIIRASIIAALMRSISPSAIIIGPMMGILLEGILLEYSIRLFGKNKLGYFTGAFFTLSSNLIQKIVVILVFYGFDIVVVLENMYHYALNQLHLPEIKPSFLIISLLLIYSLFALLAVTLGILASKKDYQNDAFLVHFDYDEKSSLFVDNPYNKQRLWLLIIHFVMVFLGLFLLSFASYYIAYTLVILYVIAVKYKYPNSFRRVAKPKFWLQLFIIVLFASLFFNGFSSNNFLDSKGILAGVSMSFRAVLIVTAFTAISFELRNPIIKAVLYKKGYSQLYISLGIAFGVLPSLLSQIVKPKNIFQSPVKQIAQLLGFSDKLLISFQAEARKEQKIIIISGLQRQGKTTFLREVISILKENDVSFNGIIAEGIDKQGKRDGFKLIHLKDNSSYLLATRTPTPNWEKTGRFYFNEKIFHELSDKILDSETSLLVIDEIGPLELQDKAWAQLIDSGIENNIPMIWVVRKSLLERVIQHWQIPQAQVFDIKKYTSQKVANAILKIVK